MNPWNIIGWVFVAILAVVLLFAGVTCAGFIGVVNQLPDNPTTTIPADACTDESGNWVCGE